MSALADLAPEEAQRVLVLAAASLRARQRTTGGVAPAPRYEPFTLDHFREWASGLILDTGEPWRLEPWQGAFIEDVLGGFKECWLVVPEGNGKTTTLAGLALYYLEFTPHSPQVPVSAAAREQAEVIYRQAEGFVLRSPRLLQSVHSDLQEAKGKRKTEVPRFTCLEGYRRINHFKGGRLQVYSADDATGDGVIPTLGIIDEPHRQKNLSLYRTWSGKLAKRDGQIVAISTRGTPGSDFENTVQRIKESATDTEQTGSFSRYVAGRVVLHEWALPEEHDPEDIAAVKAANPFSGITEEMLAAKLASPTMTMHHWLRFVCNRPTEDIDTWLGPDAARIWADLTDPYQLVPGAKTWVGVDVGIKRDSTAVVTVQQRPDEDGKPNARLHMVLRSWVPTESNPVDTTDVMQHLRELARTYDVQAVAFDPWHFDVAAQFLVDEGLPMVETPQSGVRMHQAVGSLYAAIVGGTVTHDEDALFTRHILDAVPRYDDRGFVLTKGKSRGRIDAAVAAALAVDRAERTLGETSVYIERGLVEL